MTLCSFVRTAKSMVEDSPIYSHMYFLWITSKLEIAGN